MAEKTISYKEITPRPVPNIWRRFLLLLPLLLVLTLVSRAHIHAVGGSYDLPAHIWGETDLSSVDESCVKLSQEGIVEVRGVEPHESDWGNILVHLRAISDGKTQLVISPNNSSNAPSDSSSWAGDDYDLRVENGVIITNGINFSGYESIYFSIIIVLATLLALFVSMTIALGKNAWYSSQMIVSVGGAIYTFVQLFMFILMGVLGYADSFFEIASTLSSLANVFVVLSAPVMAIVSLLLAISNISLIRHEGFRPTNLLGIALGVVWLIVIVLWWNYGMDAVGSLEELRMVILIQAISACIISFGEALFLATMLCGWRAAKHSSSFGKEYVIILGCGLRDDGSPMPLLQGRIDRALAFEREQYEATGRHATFVPSGGQGDDEIWSEAESMRRALMAVGVPDERIICEDRSVNTRENMAFSRERIDEARVAAGLAVEEQDGWAPYNIAFATTNYHVFRGYTYAHAAGLAIEGLGAKTRAYFWPNAFLREFAGLLVAERIPIALSLIIVTAFHVALMFALNMV